MTTDPQLEAAKHGFTLPISAEMIAQHEKLRRLAFTSLTAWMHSTPEERAERAAEWKRRLAEERAHAPHIHLTLETLIDKMGWSREYAEHLVQPYCDCEAGNDGWEFCRHAQDLGLTP